MNSFADFLPLRFAEWPPGMQIGTLILLTFTSEDATTISAGLLAGIGLLNWKVAFAGCFLGIWVGDAGLYLLARMVGRPVLKWRFFQRFFQTVERSEEWFHQRGFWLLFTSRLLPGFRLPTYLAAGLVRLPFPRFLLYTGLACFLWTVGIFLIAHWVGPELLQFVSRFRSGFIALLVAVVLLLFLLRFLLKTLRRNLPSDWRTALGRWRRWEFWPAWLFYPPVASCCLCLALRHRSLTLPTVSNPGIETGGLIGESKVALLTSLQASHPEFTAAAYLLESSGGQDRFGRFLELCHAHHLTLPLVFKPDVGQRGSGVKMIESVDQAKKYLANTTFPIAVQRYAPGPCEAGIFYYRFPHEPKGRILAITEKVFPFITGDGNHTVEELILRDARARFQAATYLARLSHLQGLVLPAGNVLPLVRAGNHAQGCIFRDGMHLWSRGLEERVDQICQSLHEFYIGRFDVRYADPAALQAGTGFQVVELNGAASEVTSIYDPRNSLIHAYAVLFNQWRLVFAIGAANRRRGFKPMGLLEVWKRWRQYFADAAQHPIAD